MQARREKAWAAAKKSVILDLVRQETRKPAAYSPPCRKTITKVGPHCSSLGAAVSCPQYC